MTDDSESGTTTKEPDHGETDECGTRYWCTSCKTYVPEFNWDFHERYHNPERKITKSEGGNTFDVDTDGGSK